jgi:GTP cyclohydrolase II
VQSARAETRPHGTASALDRHQGIDSSSVTAFPGGRRDLAANAENEGHFAGTAEAASHAAAAAIRLAKLSRRLPAVLAAEVPNLDSDLMHLLVTVEADAVNRFTADATNAFALASDGRPDFTQPVPVRLHSACLTGDVFGSRPCDCGDQLRLTLARLDSLGGGVILYMA